MPPILTLVLIGEEKKSPHRWQDWYEKYLVESVNELAPMMVTLMPSILLLQIESMKNSEADPNLFFWMLKKLGTNLNHL